MKISSAVFIDFLQQIQGPSKHALDEAFINVEADKMWAFVPDPSQQRQVKVVYLFPAPVTPMEFALSNLRTLIPMLKKLPEKAGTAEFDITIESAKVKIMCGKKSLVTPQVAKEYVKQGKALKSSPPVVFSLEEPYVKDLANAISSLGERPLVTLEGSMEAANLHIKIESGKLSTVFEADYPTQTSGDFKCQFRMMEVLDFAEGGIEALIGLGAPLIFHYMTKSGIEVTHTLAPYALED